MSKRYLAVLVFLLALVPSAQFAWQNRDMPEFADLHDDGLLFVSAQSLAQGHGYRIASLPERPYQTKYPPLYPWFLSLIWLLNPAFPQNLVLASAICWLTLVLCLWLALVLYKEEPALQKYQLWMLALLGLCPYMVLFGARMFSEIPFTCLALGTLISLRRGGLAARQKPGWVAFGAILAAASYLTRTAGVALIASSLILMASRRQWRGAAIFASITGAAMLGWSLWTSAHLSHSTDFSFVYYVDYMGSQTMNVGWDNLLLVLWKNVDQILYGMGSLTLPKIIDLLPVKILAQVIAIAMISGIVRLVRKGIYTDYALFALFSCCILAVWHYPPNERFVLPLYPLLLAGLFTEMEHLWHMLRATFQRPKWGDRIVAAGFGAVTASVIVGALAVQGFVAFHFLQESTGQKRVKLAERRQAYAWLKQNTPADAAVFSYDDPLLYLYTGRRSSSNPLRPRYWYAQDHASIVNAYRNFSAFCQRRSLSYVYFTSEDALRETGEDDRQAIESLIANDPGLDVLYHAGIGSIFRVKDRVKSTEKAMASAR